MRGIERFDFRAMVLRLTISPPTIRLVTKDTKRRYAVGEHQA
jgi:hypothetical protein